MKNLYLLPSPNPSRLYYFGDSPELRLTKYPNLFRVFERSAQHIYITNNDKFSKDQYITDGIEVIKASSKLVEAQGLVNRRDWKKIILTTDGVLINEGVQAIPEEFLKWFVENPKCESVEINEKSRCCGRCNGVDDLCYTDMCCDDHHAYRCEICYGKRVEYSITIPIYCTQKVLTEEDIFNQRDIDVINAYIKIDQLVDEEAKKIQKQHLIDMMKGDGELGLYEEPKMKNIPTAKEFIINNEVKQGFLLTNNTDELNDIIKSHIEFAKLHTVAALKAASDNLTDCHISLSARKSNIEEILKAYPLTNIR